MWKLIFKRLFNKRKPLSYKVRTRLVRLVVIPIGIVAGLVVSWFAFDGFMMYFIALQQGEHGGSEFHGFSFTPWDPSTDWVENSVGGVDGVSGLNNMLINSMEAGYYKEYLAIVRDHCNWSKMHPEVKQAVVSGDAVNPPISLILGMTISESGVQRESPGVSPNSTLSINSYANDGKHTLSMYNSEVCREDGGSTLAQGYFGDMDLFWSGATDVRTHCQFGAGYAALYPSGRYTATATYYPSRMNGYEISQSTLRDRTMTDACYMPDDVSIMIQRAWVKAMTQKFYNNPDRLTLTGAVMSAYPFYNAGEGCVAYLGLGMQVGSLKSNPYWGTSNWDSRNTLTVADGMASGMNWLGEALDKELQILGQDYEVYAKGLWPIEGNSFVNHDDYVGFAIGTILLNGGFVAQGTSYSERNVKSIASNGARMRGFTMAYRLYNRNPSATVDEAREWINSEKYNKQTVEWMNENYPGHSQNWVYWTTPDAMVYAKGASKAVPALHTANWNVLRSIFIVPVAGAITYWKMLLTAGVECTFGDALNDGGALFVKFATEQIDNPSVGVGANSGFVSPWHGMVGLKNNTSSMRDRKGVGSSGVHGGDDYSSAYNTPLAAVRAGVIDYAAYNGTAGNMVRIKLDPVFEGEPALDVVYMHLTSFSVKAGDHVDAGQLIGYSGHSGGNYANHLHLEVHVYRDGNGHFSGERYSLSFRSLFENVVNVFNAPGFKTSTKTKGGYVYGCDTSQILKSDQEIVFKGKTYHPFSGSLESDADAGYDNFYWKYSGKSASAMYYENGLNRYIPLALEQYKSRKVR